MKLTIREAQDRLRSTHGHIKDQLDEILGCVAEINNRLGYLDEDIELLEDLWEVTE